MPKPPTCKDLLSLVNDADLLTAVVQGHQCMDDLFGLAISEALPVRHTVEVERLSFPLKVDLSVALALLSPDSRAAFLRFNRIRNAFAHKRGFSFSEKDSTDLRNALGTLQKRMFSRVPPSPATPEMTLRMVFAVLFMEARGMVSRGRDQRVADSELMAIVKEVLGPAPKGGDPADMARIESVVRAARSRRRADGEP